jgi:hypothetical protein
MAFPTLPEYESLVYSVLEAYPQVIASTLRIYSTSALTAIVEGELQFDSSLRLRIVEALDFKAGRIQDYSYTLWRGDERICWYDAQPHPELPELTSTFPHHRHEPPDVKHNRRPAPGITFQAPNLPTLIADCVELGKTLNARP